TLYPSPGAEVGLSKPNASGSFTSLATEANMASVRQVSVSASYRLGRLRPPSPGGSIPTRWEAGPQFSGLFSISAFRTSSVDRRPGVGGFVSYRLAKYCFADATVMMFPHSRQVVHTPFDG